MAGRSGSRWNPKEERTVAESRLIGLSKPQRLVLERASEDIWATASELGTTTAATRTLVKRGLLLSNLVNGELCFKLRRSKK